MATQNPQRVIRQLQPLEPPVRPEDIDQRLNIVESLLGGLGPEDDFLRGVLINQADILRILRDDPSANTLGRVETLLERLIMGNVNTGDLAIGTIGRAAQDIANGDEGEANFEVSGTEFQATVEAKKDIAFAQPIVVVERPNIVEPTRKVENLRQSDADDGVVTVEPKAYIQATNEEWVQKGETIGPETSFLDYPSPMTAGDETDVVRIVSEAENIELFVQAAGVTPHTADMDNDGDEESVVRYHYQYQEQIGGDWKEHDGLTDVQQLGNLTHPEPLLPGGGFVGPVYGFKIRFENRSDEGSFNAHSVDQDDIGGRLLGRATVQ